MKLAQLKQGKRTRASTVTDETVGSLLPTQETVCVQKPLGPMGFKSCGFLTFIFHLMKDETEESTGFKSHKAPLKSISNIRYPYHPSKSSNSLPLLKRVSIHNILYYKYVV